MIDRAGVGFRLAELIPPKLMIAIRGGLAINVGLATNRCVVVSITEQTSENSDYSEDRSDGSSSSDEYTDDSSDKSDSSGKSDKSRLVTVERDQTIVQ